LFMTHHLYSDAYVCVTPPVLLSMTMGMPLSATLTVAAQKPFLSVCHREVTSSIPPAAREPKLVFPYR